MRKKSIKKEIGEYIIKKFKADEGVFVDYTPLCVYMDSLDMIDLVTWVERRYRIEIPTDYDFSSEWSYLNDVVKYVEKMLEERA